MTEYNWSAIGKGALPSSILAAWVVYSDLFELWGIWLLVIVAIVSSLGITYYFDKKRHNIYTAAFVVLIVVMVVMGLRSLGMI